MWYNVGGTGVLHLGRPLYFSKLGDGAGVQVRMSLHPTLTNWRPVTFSYRSDFDRLSHRNWRRKCKIAHTA